jgi:ABC-type glycerol-3-phosphate transport system substrate-binding protein
VAVVRVGSSIDVYQAFDTIRAVRLAKKAASVLNDLGCKDIEKIDEKIFYGAIWASASPDDPTEFSKTYSDIRKHPLYEGMKMFLRK